MDVKGGMDVGEKSSSSSTATTTIAIDESGGAQGKQENNKMELFAGDQGEEIDQNDLDVDVNVDLGALDLTSIDIDMAEIDESIKANLNDEVVREALAKGLNLREYLHEVDSTLIKLERESFQDYLQEGPKLAQLHHQILSCDTILETMEGSLLTFQNSLGAISSEIEVLQAQSLSLDQKLNNRRALQAPLLSFITHCSISPDLVEAICRGNVTETYYTHTEIVESKMQFVEKNLEHARGGPELVAQLSMLRDEACRRIRGTLLERIGGMRKPLSNIELQQSTLIKFRHCYDFLNRHSKEGAQEVRDNYIDTMGKIHFTYFREYTDRLRKLQEDIQISGDDLLAVEDSSKRSFFGVRATPKSRSAPYSLGNRGNVLSAMEAPVIVPHTVTADVKLSTEAVFRSTQYALLQVSAREFLFCQEFFGQRDQRSYESFKAIMGRVLSMFLQNLQLQVAKTFDLIGLCLYGCLSYGFQAILVSQEILCLVPYFEAIDSIVWPRAQTLFDAHIESIRTATVATVGVPDTLTHFVIRRASELCSTLATLSDGRPLEGLVRNLTSLREEAENFILRMAAELSERKDQLVFIINNYDLLRVVYREHNASPVDAAALEKVISDRTREFVEEALRPSFGGIVAFVRDVEALMARGTDADSVPIDQRKIQGLIRAFAADWKRAIDAIDADVMRSFSNFKVGTVVLQEVLAQLVEYYRRFLELLRLPGISRRTGAFSDLIDRHHVMVEVKKHKPAML